MQDFITHLHYMPQLLRKHKKILIYRVS